MISDSHAVAISKPITVAIVLQSLLLIYLQIIEWVDLFPWNDIQRGNSQETLDVVLGLVMSAAIFFTYRQWRPGIWLATLIYLVWLGLQIMTFWVPYFMGATDRWAKIHAANFAQTIQWLPSQGNHLPPDASHFVLQVLILMTVAATGVAAVRLGGQTHGR